VLFFNNLERFEKLFKEIEKELKKSVDGEF
jgi:hypothetical protein